MIGRKRKGHYMFRFIKRMVLFILSFTILLLGVTGYAYFIEPDLLRVKCLSIRTEKEVRPCKIVFFTDTHFGKYYSETHVETIVKKINERDADFVIFGGDLLDNYARDRNSLDMEYLEDKFSEMQAAAGKYAVWGNHDYGGGAVRIYEDFMSSCGFELLNDESRLSEAYGITIWGYDDYLMGWTDPSLYTIESDCFQIIASHEPVISKFIESGSDSFLLSGHTHGGQVTIPFVTSKLLPEGSGTFQKGFYSAQKIETSAPLQMYVSDGIGMTRYPFRFLNIPEIVEVNILPAK